MYPYKIDKHTRFSYRQVSDAFGNAIDTFKNKFEKPIYYDSSDSYE